MADVVANGQQASATQITSALAAIRALGTQALTQIASDQLNSLINFQRRLSALNGRRDRANRVQAANVAVLFVTSDFLDVDQADTRSLSPERPKTPHAPARHPPVRAAPLPRHSSALS